MLELLRSGTPYQLGILVPDLEVGLDRYSRMLGLGPWLRYVYSADTVPDFMYRGGSVEFAIEIAFCGQAPQIELIEVRGRPSFYHEWIDVHGYGLHHLGVRVESVPAAAAEMEAAGYPTLLKGLGFGLDGDGGFAYFDTVGELGVIVEAIAPPARRRPPDGVWPEG